MSNINERIKQLIGLLDSNTYSYAKKCGISPNTLNPIIKGKLGKRGEREFYPPSYEVIVKIILHGAPLGHQVSCKWLLLGAGEPFEGEKNDGDNEKLKKTVNALLSYIEKLEAEIEGLKKEIKEKNEGNGGRISASKLASIFAILCAIF